MPFSVENMNFKKRYLLAIIPLLIVGSILYYFSDIVTYVVLAWVLSMIGAPLTIFLRKYIGKTMSAIVTLIIFVLGMGLMIYIFIPPLVQQARNLAGVDYERVINGLEEPIADWQSWLERKGLLESNGNEVIIDTISKKEEPLVVTRSIHLDSLISAQGDTIKNTNISLVINIQNPGVKPEEERVDQTVQHTDSFFQRIRKNLSSFINPSIISQILSSIVGWFGNLIIAFMSILFISFFFLREQGLFNTAVSSVIPDKYEAQTIHAIEDTSRLLIRYFTGIIFQITTITLFVSIVLSILGIQNALLIGFFAALMNVIPYIGPIIGASFGVIITLASFADPNISTGLGQVSFYNDILPDLIKVVIVFAVMQMLDNFILQPNISSKSVKAHPLEIFIVVLVGAKIGGIPGMVLAIPIYTVLRVVAKVFLSEFKIVQSITRSI